MVKPSLKINILHLGTMDTAPLLYFKAKNKKGPTMYLKISREKTISEILIFYDDDRIEDKSVDFL